MKSNIDKLSKSQGQTVKEKGAAVSLITREWLKQNKPGKVVGPNEEVYCVQVQHNGVPVGAGSRSFALDLGDFICQKGIQIVGVNMQSYLRNDAFTTIQNCVSVLVLSGNGYSVNYDPGQIWGLPDATIPVTQRFVFDYGSGMLPCSIDQRPGLAQFGMYATCFFGAGSVLNDIGEGSLSIYYKLRP